MAASRIYSQRNTTVVVNGTPLVGLMDGDPIKLVYRGGEVERTEGTDGTGINRATDQGADLHVTLRENSPSHAFLRGLRRIQGQLSSASPPATVQLMTGANIIATLLDVAVGVPGELTTGGKKMGSREYQFAATAIDEV
jgi:hypothetical protein